MKAAVYLLSVVDSQTRMPVDDFHWLVITAVSFL